MSQKQGFVYILEVNDIILPVCKIGMTKRTPQERCNEINNSSTGDFIWSVAHYIYVNDCQKFESLVHSKLKSLRQKGREFFGLNADDANNALISILKSQSEIKEIEYTNAIAVQKENKRKPKRKKSHMNQEEIEMIHSFASILNIKVRDFGQSGKEAFGVSDGKVIQWNLGIWRDSDTIKLGVNLEGSQKTGKWLIADFILNELAKPTIETLQHQFDTNLLKNITIRFARDAWRGGKSPPNGGTRVTIAEKYLGSKEFVLSEINTTLWNEILTEALGCLNKDKAYRGRAIQKVTEILKNGNKKPNLSLGVSPHLTIQTKIKNDGNMSDNLQQGFTILKPVYDWVQNRCGIN
jgi:hypothetical protein